MEAAGATFVMGDFIDRLTRDGSLTRAVAGAPIWKQYPLEAQVSDLLVQCWCHKVVLCRADCELTSGHHNVIRPAVPLLARRGVIHHFKWRAGLADARCFRFNEPDVSAEDFRSEILAVNLQSGHYHSLRDSAVPIWRLLMDGQNGPTIVKWLAPARLSL